MEASAPAGPRYRNSHACLYRPVLQTYQDRVFNSSTFSLANMYSACTWGAITIGNVTSTPVFNVACPPLVPSSCTYTFVNMETAVTNYSE